MVNVSFACLTIGSELLDGRVIDTNSRFLAKSLWPVGLSLQSILTCGDNLCEITRSLTYLSSNYRLIIITGGLGPTDDDLTRLAVAQFCGVELVESQQALENITGILRMQNRELGVYNRRQAFIPADAIMVTNSNGTAPGFIKEHQGCTLVALPGVPREMYAMINDSVLPFLENQLKVNNEGVYFDAIRVAGIPESVLNEVLSPIHIPEGVELAFQVKYPEIIVQLRGDVRIKQIMSEIVGIIPGESLISNSADSGAYHDTIRTLNDRAESLVVYDGITSGYLVHEFCEIERELPSCKDNKCIRGAYIVCEGDAGEVCNTQLSLLCARHHADWCLLLYELNGAVRIGVGHIHGDQLRVCKHEINRPFNQKLRHQYIAWLGVDVLRRTLKEIEHFNWVVEIH
jgi:nicotinamide-nucleotide amidase